MTSSLQEAERPLTTGWLSQTRSGPSPFPVRGRPSPNPVTRGHSVQYCPTPSDTDQRLGEPVVGRTCGHETHGCGGLTGVTPEAVLVSVHLICELLFGTHTRTVRLADDAQLSSATQRSNSQHFAFSIPAFSFIVDYPPPPPNNCLYQIKGEEIEFEKEEHQVRVSSSNLLRVFAPL